MPSKNESELDFLTIDPHELPEQWQQQPRLFYHWSKKVADARQALDEADAELDVVDAELSLNIRDEPEKYGLEKITEASVSSTILLQPKHKKALKAKIEARHTLDTYQAAVSALDHKKKGLEKHVDLLIAGLYSLPKQKPHNQEKIEEFKSEQRKKQKSKELS